MEISLTQLVKQYLNVQCERSRSRIPSETSHFSEIKLKYALLLQYACAHYCFFSCWSMNFNGFLNSNVKRARPWMLAPLKIIWQFHAHPVHQKVSRFFGPRYIGDDFFWGPNLVSFNQAVIPYEISKVNFRVETKT